MANLPNYRHSVYLNEMCEALNLIEPLRFSHPDAKKYSYKPYGTLRKNRSRIDFFLMSNVLYEEGIVCEILDHALGTCFDHRPVFVTFPGPATIKRGTKKLQISNSILRDPDLDIVAWYAVFETYLHYLSVGVDLIPDLNNTLTICGNVRRLLKEAGPCLSYYVDDLSEEKINKRRNNLAQIREIIDTYPVELLYNFELNISPDLFLEVLINNFRNEITSYQSFIFKFKRYSINCLKEELKSLLLTGEYERIEMTEMKLEQINEQIIRDKLDNSNLFDILNNEKMTPFFLKLAKIKKKTGTLNDICNDDGIPFISSEERENFIYNHFCDIYGGTHVPVSLEDINTFFGPEVALHPLIASKKLPDNLKIRFESPLSQLELENALKSAKSNSAGGSDGINNRVLKKYWSLFKAPLHEYAKQIPISGLTPSFREASIKLIPKKGDLTKISNWRPISLLNCIYKIISRALNKRLQEAAPFILTRAQKGFVKNRFIQECLINVLEKMAFCNNHKIPALAIAIDQSKAFDKLSHSFMTAVYKFFNFGENFIKLLDGIGNGRTACILWEDGSRSKHFPLKSGRAQGDGPSPLQYNFAEQILLLKIELDPDIKPAFTLAIEAAHIPVPLPWFEAEINAKTNKVEALADDTTVLIKCCRTSLLKLHNSLVQFEALSGLECNFEKTCIIPFGGIDTVPFDIAQTNLQVTNQVKLLGLTIDSKLDCLSTVHDKTYEKIAGILNFWSRFWLSLPGRINIVKTLCLSQLNYLACIITPSANQLNKIEEIILKFVKGKLNISRDRLYTNATSGGLGLINLNAYICSQQTQWIKRVLFAACDTWREQIFNITYGNPLILTPLLFNREEHPILYNIAKSFVEFKIKFWALDDNYKKAPIFYNPVLHRGRGDTGLLDRQFFTQNPPLDLSILAKCKFNAIFRQQPVPIDTINLNLNMGLNINTYLRLTGSLSNFFRSLKQNRPTNGTSLDLLDFFKSYKKGSKGIRKIIMATRTQDVSKLRCIVSFGNINGITIADIGDTLLKRQIGLWACSFLKNELREFIFKFYNNSLGINTRVSHFVDNVSRNCTFCSLKNVNHNDETFVHLFINCEQLISLRSTLYDQLFRDLNLDQAGKKMLWLGFPPLTITDTALASISILLIQFLLWKNKLKKKIPVLNRVKSELFLELRALYKIKRELFSYDINYALSRNIDNLLSDGHH
jgi:hypothetical protein